MPLKLACPSRCLLDILLLSVSYIPRHSQGKFSPEEARTVNRSHVLKEKVTIAMQITATELPVQ